MANGIVVTPGMNNSSTTGQSSNFELTKKLAGQDLSAVCQCGTCTISSFLQNGCPHPSQIPSLSLPFLEALHLDGVQRQILIGRLYLEYQMILSKFSKLKKDFSHLVNSNKITFSHLSKLIVRLDSFMPSLPQDDKISEVKKLKTINKLFSLFPDGSSFLEYHVFEDLANALKIGELKAIVCTYKKDLEDYCKRGIFECPSYAPTGKPSHSNLILEMQGSHSKMTIEELMALEDQLCGVLSVLSNTLCPCSVSKMQKGSIQIIFRIPNFVKEVLLPLSPNQQSALRQLGFLDWSFYNGVDISYDAAQLADQLLATERLQDSMNHNATGGHATHSEGQRIDDLSSDDDDDDTESSRKKLKPAPGKKTRGRVKIPMEYIKNKLRRYTTFSKRKSNIMKKAYELSTLTGTQVMLMVASETGHVYTFATPKLQPMITSEAGKALIQTCLHQPDPVVTTSNESDSRDGRVRMSSSGFEETDLSNYLPGAGDERNKCLTSSSTSSLLTSTSSLLTSTVDHGIPSMYNPSPSSSLPLSSLANELLPSGMLHSLVTSSSHSLLPPPLISEEDDDPDNEG